MAERLTQIEIAKRWGRGTAWVRELTTRGVLRRGDDRLYDWHESDAAYRAFQEEAKRERAGATEEDEYQAQRTRLTRERAEEIERENRIKRGELVEAADVADMVREPLERVNAILKHVPAKYGTKLARRSKLRLPEARALLSEIIEAVRAELRAA